MYLSENIEVPLLNLIDRDSGMKDISTALDDVQKYPVSHAPWPEFSYKPDCAFAIAHGNDCIFLKYFVVEANISARFIRPNDLVYKDSCVEFCIAFNGEPAYYNLEFNCIGTGCFGYGTGKEGREEVDPAVIKKVRTISNIIRENETVKWELSLMIPVEVFYQHHFSGLAAVSGKANFYKCGDELPVPHYLSWNNIESAAPNFHLPDFFGGIRFGATSED